MESNDYIWIFTTGLFSGNQSPEEGLLLDSCLVSLCITEVFVAAPEHYGSFIQQFALISRTVAPCPQQSRRSPYLLAPSSTTLLHQHLQRLRQKMQRNITIAVIIIVLFVLLTLIGFLIWWMQNGFPRRGGGASEYSDEESAH